MQPEKSVYLGYSGLGMRRIVVWQREVLRYHWGHKIKRGRGLGMMAKARTGWLQRQAFQIASQLPEETEDALAILSYVERLVAFPFDEPPIPPDTGHQSVVNFPNTPSLRANSSGSPSGLPK